MQFNRVIIAGNLAREPELRYTPQGVAVLDVSLAVNRSWKTETGEAKEDVSFFDVTFFKGAAETVAQYCKKGAGLLVEGKLKQETWEDKQTKQKRSRIKIIAETFQFGSKPAGAPAATPNARKATPAVEPEPEYAGGHGVDASDDVPF